MKMVILGWGYENIRRFDTLDVQLDANGALPHIVLVMMSNGTGKTTTITLMRGLLSRSAERWDAKTIREFRPLYGQPSAGKFYMKMLFDGEERHLILHLDYSAGKVRFQTSRVGLSGGLEDKLDLPMELRGAFDNENFVKRFIFDGEEARATLKSPEGEAENAIVNLYQLDQLDNLTTDIDRLVELERERSFGKGNEQSVAWNKGKMENKLAKWRELQKRRDALSEKKRNITSQQESLRNEKQALIESNEDLRSRQRELLDKKAQTQAELYATFQDIDTQMKRPYQISPVFDRRMKEFAQNLKAMQLPKSISKEFFKDLAESDKCICGRDLGEEHRERILEIMDQYLGEEHLIAVNSIKGSINDYVPDDSLKETFHRLISQKETLQKTQSALNRLSHSLSEQDSKRIERIETKLEILEAESAPIDRELHQLNAPLNSPGVSHDKNIQKAQAEYEDALEKYERASGTYEFIEKAKRLKGYIHTVRAKAICQLKAAIMEKANHKIDQILHDEKLVIDQINGNLVLKDKGGASEGQTLAVAYAYIGSLFAHSAYEFPFVVDSPAASMDLEVRREVAGTIPDLFEQLVIFVTSGEKAGFGEKFYGRDDVLYATITGQNDREGARCHYGKGFFSSYQSEEE